ncbi:MAG: hypothetical protein ACK5LO_09065 [Leucobacter sp.]
MIDINSLGPVLMMLTAIVTIGAFVLGSHRSLSRQFDTKLDGMDSKFEAKFDAMDAKFEAMDAKFEAKFDAVNARFDAIDSRFDGIDRRLDRLDRRVDGIDSRLDAVDRRFDRLEGRLGEHEAKTAVGFHEIHVILARLSERFDAWERFFFPHTAATTPEPQSQPELVAR